MSAFSTVIATVRSQLEVELDSPDVRFVVGFSGGLDSTVLLLALVRLVDASRILAVHVDHGLHPASPTWAQRCRALCDSVGVTADVRRVTLPLRGNREELARRARYRAFESALTARSVLLLAHHADDQAETLLLRLVRGRLPRGMPDQRRLGPGRLTRPLLALPRSVLAAAARELAVDWIEDSSNADLSLDRNYLRHAVLPLLESRWPDIAVRLAAQATRIGEEGDLGRAALDATLDAMPRDVFLESLLDRPHGTRLLRRWLERAGITDVPDGVFVEIDRQRRTSRGAATAVAVAVKRGTELRRFGDGLHLTRTDLAAFAAQSWVLSTGARAVLDLPGWRLSAIWTGDGDAAERRLEVRPRSGGERLRPQGRGGSRSVKRLLQEARVLPWRRQGYPLIYCGGRLAVLANIAVDEGFADVFVTAPRDIDRPAAAARWLIELTPRADA